MSSSSSSSSPTHHRLILILLALVTTITQCHQELITPTSTTNENSNTNNDNDGDDNAPRPIRTTPPTIADYSNYFRVRKDNNDVWWFVDPTGHDFVSTGVTSVNAINDFVYNDEWSPYYRNVAKRYGNHSEWVNATRARLREWNFNTLGAWTYMAKDVFPGMPWTVAMSFDQQETDWFSWEFENQADLYAERVCAPLKHDPHLIGYFTGNEIHWGYFIDRYPHTFYESETYLLFYLKMGTETEGHKAAMSFLKVRYEDIHALNKAWNIQALSFSSIPDGMPFKSESRQRVRDYISFIKIVAQRYFSVVHDSIRRHDPNHLILGSRYSYWEMPDIVVQIESLYTDVISFNGYLWWPGFDAAAIVGYLYEQTGRPILISEFSVRSSNNTSGNMNTLGAGYPVHSQEKRADLAVRALTSIVAQPACVGYHWFQYVDQPAQGRAHDGENSNTGLVDIHDDPYYTLTDALTNFNLLSMHTHAGSYSVAM